MPFWAVTSVAPAPATVLPETSTTSGVVSEALSAIAFFWKPVMSHPLTVIERETLSSL